MCMRVSEVRLWRQWHGGVIVMKCLGVERVLFQVVGREGGGGGGGGGGGSRWVLCKQKYCLHTMNIFAPTDNTY